MNWTRLPRTDPETSHPLVVIETPRGSGQKFSYDPGLNMLRLKKLLPLGMAFPYNFGFFPSTRAEDGDPLDALVIFEDPLPPGCILAVRVLGVFRAEQKERDKDWLRNDRFVVRPSPAQTYGVETIDALSQRTRGGIEAFFVQYNRVLGREFRITGVGAEAEALRMLEEAAV